MRGGSLSSCGSGIVFIGADFEDGGRGSEPRSVSRAAPEAGKGRKPFSSRASGGTTTLLDLGFSPV